jgi:hypothetical protein
MWCLPPVVAPFPNDFARVRGDRAQEVTKPLLYQIHLVPVLLGGGIRLFEGLDPEGINPLGSPSYGAVGAGD